MLGLTKPHETRRQPSTRTLTVTDLTGAGLPHLNEVEGMVRILNNRRSSGIVNGIMRNRRTGGGRRGGETEDLKSMNCCLSLLSKEINWKQKMNDAACGGEVLEMEEAMKELMEMEERHGVQGGGFGGWVGGDVELKQKKRNKLLGQLGGEWG